MGSFRAEGGKSGVSRVNITAVAIIRRHPDWWHSWHRDFMLIGIAVLIAGTLLGFLAVKKPGWIRWTVIPISLLVLYIGFRVLFFAFGYY